MKDYSKANNILNKINLGWNLGNYLDAHDKQYIIGTSNNKSVDEITALWGNETFNLKCFDELKKYGINCVRIPVTWCNFITIKNKKVSISAELINHLKEIINYGISKDFIIILDMHHDDQTWLKVACSKKEFKQVRNQYKNIWKNIAFEFKDFNENLIFEGMNEVIDRSNPEKFDWWGHNQLHYKRLNSLYNLFVKSVRKFSLENKKRTLMLSTYGAQIHTQALKRFKMVRDKNTIVDLHHYTRLNTIKHLEEQFMSVFQYLTSKNIPIVLGEIGAKKDCFEDFSIIENYLNFAKSHNLKCILWDNGSSRTFINRQTAKLTHNKLKIYLKNN